MPPRPQQVSAELADLPDDIPVMVEVTSASMALDGAVA